MTEEGKCEVCGFTEEDNSLHIYQLHAELKRLREENKEYAQEVSHLHMRINDIKHGHDD